ncbi:MAG TPA: hypothetical protein VJ824_00115 [Bacillota bacterium]|nr:hypothetical protein [Bacillota bacterium]
MITGDVFSSILRTTAYLKPNLELFPGQIVRGQVIKQMPEQQALVQIGSLKVLAKMETALSVGDQAWLQVQKIGEPTLLKVLSTSVKNTDGSISDSNLANLTKSLHLDDSELSKVMVARLIEEKLPVQPREVQHMKELIQQGHSSLETTIFAYQKGFPLTEEVVEGLEQFFNGIVNPKTAGIDQELMKELVELFEQNVDKDPEGIELVRNLRTVLNQAKGEGVALTGEHIQRSLKLFDQLNLQLPVLKDHMKKSDSPEHEKLEQVARFITGQQLLLSPTETSLQQWLIHLPLQNFNQSFVQVESQKQPNGQIDPDNCHMIFCLDLEKLGSLIVDVYITNKIVSVEVCGDHPELSPLTQMFREELMNGLKDLGYNLSIFRDREQPDSNKAKNPQNLVKPYKGVDLRV